MASLLTRKDLTATLRATVVVSVCLVAKLEGGMGGGRPSFVAEYLNLVKLTSINLEI